MATLETSTQKPCKKGLTQKLQKKSTTVDLTPMVDLGFLLITFFIFATTIAQPKAVQYRVPNDTTTTMKMEIERTVIIIADSANHYYSYEPNLSNTIDLQQHTKIDGVRKQLINKKSRLPRGKPSVILKMHPDSKYNNLIEMLDEMKINDIDFYVMDKITQAEALKMANLLK